MLLHVDGVLYGERSHGGIRRVFDNLLPALARHGDVDVVLHMPCKDLRDVQVMSGVRMVQMPCTPHLRPRRLFGNLNARMHRRRVSRYWGRLQGGVFQSTYYTTHPALRIPQVLTIQDMIYEEYPALFSEPKDQMHIADKADAARRASVYVFPSEASRMAASKHYGVGQRPALVIPYALDDLFREGVSSEDVDAFRCSWSQGEEYVLHTGSRYLHKNFCFLLTAFAAWRGRDWCRLLAIGGDAVTSEELGLIRELELQERVTIIPAMSSRELVIAYHGARAFVCPSLSEGYGFPLLEAMACGVPVVAMRAGSLPEVGGDVPYWVQPGDLPGMAAAIDDAVRCGDRDRMLCGVQRAQRRTWANVAEEYVRVYAMVT